METSTKCDLKSAIEQYLATKFSSHAEKCILAVEAYESVNWKSLFRIVALIRRRRNYALVIFSAKKLANSSPHNIRVIDVIPVDNKIKISDDLTRSSSGAIQPAVLTGEDFTLIQFDPLSNPIDSQHLINQSNMKEYHLSFSKIDYLSISLEIDKAKTCPEENEVFTSFNWLQKLRDEAESSSEQSFEPKLSESDCDLRSPSDNSSSIISLRKPSDYPENLNLFSLTNATVNKQSMENLDRSNLKLSDIRNSRNHFQSTPDLLNGQTHITNNKLLETVTDDRQFEYVETKLRQKENDYCNWENHTLFVGTWNVNGRMDESIKLDDWLNPPKGVEYPTFYVLGFQELDLSIGSVALNRSIPNNLEERWLKLIESSKPFKKKNYKRLYRARLSGILIVIFVIEDFQEPISERDVNCNKVPTGMLNIMGNKGGVGFRFKAYNSQLCFINCHLAAGESNRLRRDQDFREIEKNMTFRDEQEKVFSIYKHDLVFLMGDLNYRLLNIDANEAKELIQQKMIDKLISNDELINESKSIFNLFHEGKIEFMPTYKFDSNTDDYDTSEKNRVPSYCDRIMWKGEHCKLIRYTSHMSLKISDHKPVSAWFHIGLKKIDVKKRLKVQESIIRNLDLIYNLSLPQAKVDKQEICFDKVHFYEHRQASISVKNTGQFEFSFKFKEIPGCPRVPDWLTVQPSEGKVKTGEECELIFEIFINANNVLELNTKKDVQCILVLDLQGGKDYFITVSAELVPTSFGLPLSLLVTLKCPVSTLTRSELYEKCKPFIQTQVIPAINTGSGEFTTPKEIYAMVDYLTKHVHEDELFARPGSHGDIQVIREQLDLFGINANFDNVSVHSVTETLLMFLNSLYFPVIPPQLTKECMGVNSNFLESVKVIGKLPQDHKNLFHYLTTFLRKVLDNRNYNGTDINSLAMLFVDLIFRLKRGETTERDLCAQFIKQFLHNDPVKYFRTNPLPSYQ